MSDYNPTEPDNKPSETTANRNTESQQETTSASPTDAAGQKLPTSETLSQDNADNVYEGDTRPSLGTLQSMQSTPPTQSTSDSPETGHDDLSALRSRSQPFMDVHPNTAQVTTSPPTADFSAEGAPSNDEAAMAKAANVQSRYGDRLLQLPHVVGIGIGYMKIGDQTINQVALVVMVDQKVAAEHLQPEQRIPQQIEDVPIMIQEVGTFTAFS